MSAARDDMQPILDAVDRAMQDELGNWTFKVPEELRLALSRAAAYRLQAAAMLNFDRPWEGGDDPPDPEAP